MSYISPNSNIAILKGVPLDKTYDHTVLFSDKQTQAAYFLSKTKSPVTLNVGGETTQYTFSTLASSNPLSKMSYQRVNNGVIKIQIPADILYDCNYIMFQNAAWSDKWFYAFITEINYVNNVTSEIRYELDVLQTWMISTPEESGSTRYQQADVLIDECFVARNHSTIDNPGDNLIPEDLEIGYYVHNTTYTYKFSNMGIIALVSEIYNRDTQKFETAKPSGAENGIYNGLRYLGIFRTNSDLDMDSLNILLSEYNRDGKSESVIALYQAPYDLCATDNNISENMPWKGVKTFGYKNIELPGGVNLNPVSIDGYHPKNKKLFTYPYCFLRVYNNQGGTADYKYELFSNPNSINFEISAIANGSPVCLSAPKNYQNSTTDYTTALNYGNFPVCSWTGDVYRAYLAQHGTQSVTSIVASALASAVATAGVSTIASGGTATIPAAAVAGAVSLATNGSQEMAKRQDLQNVPPQVYGQAQWGDINIPLGINGFTYVRETIKSNQARIIDSYFTRFGYAMKRTMYPKLNARPHWTYVRTSDCTATGSIPADDLAKICSIFNEGVTFWNNPNQIGDYTLDNSPQ